MTRLVLVARAQLSTLREAEKTHRELVAIGITAQYLVINGILPESESRYDAMGAALYRREQEAMSQLPEVLSCLPCDRLVLKPFNMVGIDALCALLEDQVELSLGSEPLAGGCQGQQGGLSLPPLGQLVDEIAATGKGLVMLVGKGGVGKTTVAAAVAVELAHRGHAVHLTTTDPAAHIGETLHGAVRGLTVSRIDPEAETERYREQVLKAKGASLDSEGKAVLEEDLRSPCTQEIAVFQAFSRIVREARERFVVIDTAPTGHTLLLLDATGAYHREVARQSASAGSSLDMTPMTQLQDPQETKVLIVTLAERTPVLEAAELQRDLRRAGIEPWAWIVNNSLAAAHPIGPLLARRAASELKEIEAVTRLHAGRCAVVAMQEREPVGEQALLALCLRGRSL
jgi:arsenite-transporting ATPase